MSLPTSPKNNTGEVSVGSVTASDSCRETLRISREEQAFQNHLTLGIQEKLQKNRMIRNVKSTFRKPVDKQALSVWERKNGVTLPTDLKDYYQSTNGFKLTWSLEHAGDVLPIGEMGINPLNQLTEIHVAAKLCMGSNNSGSGLTGTRPLYSLSARPKTCSESVGASKYSTSYSNASRKPEGNQDLVSNSSNLPFMELEQTLVGSSGSTKLPISGLTYSPENKMFILDSGRSSWGKVCLVYPFPLSSQTGTVASPKAGSSVSSKESKTESSHGSSEGIGTFANEEPHIEIWFMDPTYQCHYLAPTFTHFYRMLLFHLGLPQWQYRFTPFGLSSWAEQIFWLVAPHLLQSPKLSKFPSMYHGQKGLWCTDVPSEAATPNPTVNTLTNQLFRRKKKDKEKSN